MSRGLVSAELVERPHLVVAIACAVPVLLSPVVYGLDIPWHTLFSSVIHHGGEAGERYQGFLAADFRLTTYASLYALIDALSYLMSETRALQVIAAATACAWVISAAHLLAAFGRDGRAAMALAPAAYSATFAYGFAAFSLACPMLLWLWAAYRSYQLEAGRRRLVAVGVLALALSLTHAVAAAMGLFGVLALALLPTMTEGRRTLGALAVAGLGFLPALIALFAMGVDQNPTLPDFVRDASWWERLRAQPFSSPGQSFGEFAANAVHLVPGWVAVAYVGLLVAALEWGRRRAPAAEHSRRQAFWLAALFALVYLFVPYSLDWPRTMVAAQPRLVPIVLALVVLALVPRRLTRGPLIVLAGVGIVPLLFVGATIHSFGGEVEDLQVVIASGKTGASTVALIEHPQAPDRGPAHPLRHAGAYLVVEHGGIVSGVPGWARTQPWVPVTLLKALPLAPSPGYPRTFRASQHGWQQFLIRDGDPEQPFDYFRGQIDVEQVAVRGRWRLYRRQDRRR